jgi:hypothetical protein
MHMLKSASIACTVWVIQGSDGVTSVVCWLALAPDALRLGSARDEACAVVRRPAGPGEAAGRRGDHSRGRGADRHPIAAVIHAYLSHLHALYGYLSGLTGLVLRFHPTPPALAVYPPGLQ